MAGPKRSAFSPEFWLELMERDPPNADRQPLQLVKIEGGKIKLGGWRAHPGRYLPPGATLGFRVRDGHIRLEPVPDGIELNVEDRTLHEFELPPEALDLLPDGDSGRGMLVGDGGGAELMLVRVEEHPPDLMGPRFIDELQDSADGTHIGTIVRHFVRGLELEELTAERVQELEDAVCSAPFRLDPVPSLARDDWVGWQTRNRILRQPGAGDDAPRESLAEGILAGQNDDGSWSGSVVQTAYVMLRARTVEVPSDDARLHKAAEWLLARPEPDGRPGWWILNEDRLQVWNDLRPAGECDYNSLMAPSFTEEHHDLFRSREAQQVIPICARHFPAACEVLLHPSAAVAEALCRCGYTDHPRVQTYANTLLDTPSDLGEFCACSGILQPGASFGKPPGTAPTFDPNPEELAVAAESISYRYVRNTADLQFLAHLGWFPDGEGPSPDGGHPMSPYEWKDIGAEGCFPLSGSNWENADCWAKANRSLSQFPGWSGSDAEFLALYQCHLYQTPLGEWYQAFPAGILRWILEVTRATREAGAPEDSQALRFARLMLLRTVPWLRARQKDDGLWDHDELPRLSDANRPPSRRPGTYHIVAALDAFGLLDQLRP